MNQIKVFLLWTALVLTSVVQAGNSLIVADVHVESGSSVTLDIVLENDSTDLMGFQCDIVLPKGLSLALKTNGKPAATLGKRFDGTSHTLSSSVTSSGYRFLVTSLDADAIPGTSGILFSVTLEADESLETGTVLKGLVNGIEFNTIGNDKLVLDNVSFNVTIDGDTPPPPPVGNRIVVSDVHVNPGNSVTLDIALENESKDLMGFQCDIVIPKGLSLALKSNGKPAATLGKRFDGTSHTLSSSVTSGGYRFLVTSLDADSIPGTSGILFSVTLQADESLAAGSELKGLVNGIEFNTIGNDKLVLDDVLFTVTIDGDTPPPPPVGNRIVVSDVYVEPGNRVTLDIALDNENTDLMGFQCDIVLPKGLSLALKSNGKPAATIGKRFDGTSHTLSSSVTSDGYRFLVTSLDADSIPGNSGTLFSVTLEADESLETGTVLKGLVNAIEFNTIGNDKLVLDDVSFTVNIDTNNSIESLFANGQTFDVYSISGKKVLPDVMTFEGLERGIYIVDGKKVVIR